MRAILGLGTLLIYGCISDPAYLGEGPPDGKETGGTETGGNSQGGTAGTQAGSGGTSTGSGGTGGTGNAGSSGSGTAPTGGTGGTGGITPPEESASCTITYPNVEVSTVVSWNADTRTFAVGDIEWVLNEQGWVIRKSQMGQEWLHLMAYDDMGTLGTFQYFWQGAESAANSWGQANEYADGLLVSSALNFQDGESRSEAREYENGLLSLITTDRMVNGSLHRSSAVFVREDGRPTEVLYLSDGPVHTRLTTTYDDAGRLTWLDTDGGGFANADGIVDMRAHWIYDDQGRIIRFEQDGTDILDAPVVDGVFEAVSEFEPACADIAVLPDELYRLPAWLFSRPGVVSRY
jgi:hypothetical protein